MSLYASHEFFDRFILRRVPHGGPAIDTALRGQKVTVEARARLFGGEGVITLVDGRRIRAPHEAKYHLDVTLEWEHMAADDYAAFAAWVRAALKEPSSTRYYFCPRAALASGAWVPHAQYAMIEVVPDLSPEARQLAFAFEDRIRQRPGKLALLGARLTAEGDLPAWLVA